MAKRPAMNDERRRRIELTKAWATRVADWITEGVAILTEENELPTIHPLPRDASGWLALRQQFREIAKRCDAELATIDAEP